MAKERLEKNEVELEGYTHLSQYKKLCVCMCVCINVYTIFVHPKNNEPSKYPDLGS